jgi:putative flippase GtrA
MSEFPTSGFPALVRKLSEVSVIRFGVVGVSNMAISLAMFWSASRALPAWLAMGVSYAAGMIWSYYWNRRWTFKSQSNVAGEAGRFFGLQIGFLCLSSALMGLLVGHAHLHKLVAWFVVAVSITVLNFVASRYWAFKAA